MQALSWGLDVSTNKAKTAAVAIDWSVPGEARVVDVRHPLPAADMAPLIAEHKANTWAVDVPFGWPDLFVDLMAARHHGPLPAEVMPPAATWETWRTREVAQRRTDRFLTDDPRIKTRPLPASFQLLGATAAMWVLVEAQLVSLGVRVDRAGLEGTVCETYPSAALAAWGFGKAKLTWTEAPLTDKVPAVPAWLSAAREPDGAAPAEGFARTGFVLVDGASPPGARRRRWLAGC